MRTTNDTSPSAESIIINGYRKMAPWKKLRQVTLLNKAVQTMALTRIREQYGSIPEHEERLRLAALWLPRGDMIRWFGWDPLEKGY